MIRLDGQAALVTGGSRGIGRAAALMLAEAGADVGVTYHTRSHDAEAVARTVRESGRRAFVGGGDHGDPEIVAQLFREVRAAFGGLDIFVANAGVWPAKGVPLANMSATRWRTTLNANLDSIYHTTRAALALLRPGGRIILVSSTAGQRGEAGHADYAATKGAIIALTKSLALECGPDITVNCVAPGWVDTEMSAQVLQGEARARVLGEIPLARIATAEDIAGSIVFLASPLARHITGEVLNVNGGSVLCG